MAEPSVSRRPARQGLYGGLVSSRRPGAVESESAKATKKSLKPRTVLDDAIELVKARKGRLALGLLLMTINRVAGLVLPGTTKYLLDDVIGKSNLRMLTLIVFAAG